MTKPLTVRKILVTVIRISINRHDGSWYVLGNYPPTPPQAPPPPPTKPTFCPKKYLLINDSLGEGLVGSFPEIYEDQT